ncbi:VOC family protein [Paracidovorax avenae]|uniref:VOC family protein n=1 Tax=Paracidovorax avenae TaxID=80867 RepID=UPI0012602518|nr:hypothetical protein [Paracidovorax avenae]
MKISASRISDARHSLIFDDFFHLSQYIFQDPGLLLQFYVVELSLFEISADYGMNSRLIVAKENPNVGLVISEGDPAPVSSRPLFTMVVTEIAALFHRLANFNFSTGAELLTKQSLFEWPLGQNMTLKDPAGNIFIIERPYAA